MADEVRMIDKDKLIKKINAEIDAWAKSRMCMTADELLETIEEFEEEAEPDKGWISVEDRLPDDKERYLICTEDGRLDIAYYQPIGDTFSEYEPFWQGSCRFTTSVTHWRHLPEPPKGE